MPDVPVFRADVDFGTLYAVMGEGRLEPAAPSTYTPREENAPMNMSDFARLLVLAIVLAAAAL